MGFWPSKADKHDAPDPAPLSAADVERLRQEIAALGELAAEFTRRAAALQRLLPPRPPQDRIPSQRSTGTVRWFNPEKGFGFITPDEPGPDLFAHYSEIEADGFRELTDGQRVEYDSSQGPKGPQADRIRPLVG